MTTLVLNAWWGSRLESAETCALRLQDMFARLGPVHPVFGRWRQQAKTKSAAQRPFCSMPPDATELREIIAKTGERHVTGRPLPELGYWFSAWNELDAEHSLSFSCRPGQANDRVAEPNKIEFSFGKETPGNRDLLDYEVLNAVLVAVGQAWEVNWGVIEPWEYDLRPLDENGHYRRPWGGWLTYLSPSFAAKVRPPTGVIGEALSHGGLMMAVAKQRFDPNNPAQVRIYNAIQASLRPLQT